MPSTHYRSKQSKKWIENKTINNRIFLLYLPAPFPKWNPWNTLQSIDHWQYASSTTISKKLEKLSLSVLPQLPPVRQEQGAPPNTSQSIKEDTIGGPPSLRGGLHALFHRQTQMKWEATQRHRKTEKQRHKYNILERRRNCKSILSSSRPLLHWQNEKRIRT